MRRACILAVCSCVLIGVAATQAKVNDKTSQNVERRNDRDARKDTDRNDGTSIRDGKIFRVLGDERGVQEGRRELYRQRFGTQMSADPNATLEAVRQFYQKSRRDRLTILGIGGTVWTNIGPANGAGRVNNLAIHSTVPGNVYAASAGGGLWRTTDSGMTWTCLTDTIPKVAAGAVGIAPSNPNVIYLGTGDMYNYATPGIGILSTFDGGANWTLPPNVLSSGFFSILVDAANPNIVLAASANGLFRSTNGVAGPWTLTLNQTSSPGTAAYYTATSLVRDPSSLLTIYAATDDGGEWCAKTGCADPYNWESPTVVKSIDGGRTWAPAGNGLPVSSPSLRVIRVALAIAPSSPQTIYAVVPTLDGTKLADNGTWHVYKTTNGGMSWSETGLSSNANVVLSLGAQYGYNITIVVSPTDPNTVIVGGVGYAKTTDGGTTWTSLFNTTSSDYVHADAHDLKYDASGTLYIANDGGVFTTTNGGTTAAERTATMVTRQFYTLANDPVDRNRAFGGQQDNGVVRRPDAGGSNWDAVLGGDGFDCPIDSDSPTIGFASWQYGHLYRTANVGTTSISYIPIAPPWPATDILPFWTRLTADPSTASTVYTVSNRVWKSTTNGDIWIPLPTTTTDGSSFPSDSALGSVVIAPSDSKVMVAVANTALFRTIDGGMTWTNIVGTLPASYGCYNYVNGLAIDPVNVNVMYAALNICGNGASVYSTNDGGTTWNPRGTGLPEFSAEVIRIDPTDRQTLYCGTEVGVYRSTDGGGSWTRFGTGMPAVAVFDIQIVGDGTVVRAATHGRGVWELTVTSPTNRQPTVSLTSTPTGNPITINVGGTVTFSGTFSDPDGQSVKGKWTFADDWSTASAQSGGSVQHTFYRTGTFPVALIAQDSLNAIGSATIVVSVGDAADNCATPAVIPAAGPFPYSMTLDNTALSTQSSDPVGSAATGGCNRYSYDTSFWLSFTPSSTGTYTFWLTGSTITSILTGFTGTVCGTRMPAGICLFRLPKPDDSNLAFAGDASTTVTLTGGVTVYLEVTNYYYGSRGKQTLTIAQGAAAPSTVVTNVAPPHGTTNGGTAVSIVGSGFTSGASVSFGGIHATAVTAVLPTLITATTPSHSAGTVDVTVTNTNGTSGTARNSYTYVVPAVTAPTNLLATASSATSIHVSWNAVSGADHYVVYRRGVGGAFVISSSVAAPATAVDDSNVSPNTAYLYKVVAVSGGGDISLDSNSDLATTVIFSDPLIVGTTPIRAAHLLEIRTAVNAVRALARLTPYTYTDTTSFSCDHGPSGIVSWYRAEGNANDSVGTNNGSGSTSFAAGEVGQGFNFGSDADGVTIPSNTNLDINAPGFTVEFWMRGIHNQPQSLYCVAEKSHGEIDHAGWAFQGDSTSGTISFVVGNGSDFPGVGSLGDVLDGSFHHIAGVWDGSTTAIYVDGVFQHSTTLTTPVNNSRAVNFGYHWGGGTPNRFFRGTLDEVTIYSHALSAAELQGIYTAGASGKCVTSGVTIKSVHITEVRAALNAGLSALGLPPLTFANPATTGTLVRATDFTEIRNGTR